MSKRILLVMLLAWSWLGRGPSASAEEPPPPPAAAESDAAERNTGGRNVVVWISIDGLRGDYASQAKAPFLQKMMREGAFSEQLINGFPTLTFPAHVTQATGAGVDKHGIFGNAIFDFEHDRRWPYPDRPSLLLCEPIWTAAKRAGRRVLVHDWPMSHKQTGPWQADYSDDAFDTSLNDRQRLERLLSVWEQDAHDEPLQLIMGYVAGVDQTGHRYGPNAEETRAAVEAVDALLAEFFKRVQERFAAKRQPGDCLYLMLSSDHGMSEVREVINLQRLCGHAWQDEMRLVTSGPVGNIYLHRLGPPPERKAPVEKLLQALRAYPFVRAYAADELPRDWHYGCPGRTGDVVALLHQGYFFTERDGPLRQAVVPGQNPLGMHGYPADECRQMLGFLCVWRSERPWGGVDLDKQDARRLHATVAHWLNFPPAETAEQKPLELREPPAEAGNK